MTRPPLPGRIVASVSMVILSESDVPTSLVSNINEPCGSAAPLCGRASPSRAEMPFFLILTGAGGSASGADEDELGRQDSTPGGRSRPA